MKITIFFCYAHEDEPLLNKIKAQLKPLQWQGLIETWHDQDISAGTEWETETNKYLNTAQIILLLISPDFMNSDYCYGTEMKRAIERHERGEARVIPIILRPVHWRGVLGKLQVLPKNALPVIGPDWYNMDQALFNVAEGIREVVERFSVKPVEPVLLASTSSFIAEKQSIRHVESLPLSSTPSFHDHIDRVVVVAARNALPEYLQHSMYICQPNRAFQQCIRLAFYTNNKIDRRIPKILGQVEAISKDEIESSQDLTDGERQKLLHLVKSLEGPRSDTWNSQPFKFMFLSSPESPDTLCLPTDIINDLTSKNGQGTAFTQGQRYVSLSRLEKGPKTTSELVKDFLLDIS